VSRELVEVKRLLDEFPTDWVHNWCKLESCTCTGGVNCCINLQLASRNVVPISEEEWTSYMESLETQEALQEPAYQIAN
jgi:hypothetical protein